MLPRKQEQMHVQYKIKNSEALDETTYTEKWVIFLSLPYIWVKYFIIIVNNVLMTSVIIQW